MITLKRILTFIILVVTLLLGFYLLASAILFLFYLITNYSIQTLILLITGYLVLKLDKYYHGM